MKIHLINDGVSRPVDALITARIREGLDSEFTLSFTLTENDTSYIHDNTVVQYGEQYFNVVSYQKDREGRSPTCAAECEHVSYCLNDEAYELEEFVYSGSAAGALKAVLNGTPLSAGTVELSGTVNIRLTGGTRKAILLSVAAIIGGEIEYSGYTVNLRGHRGSTDYIELLGTDNVTDVSYSRDVLNGTTAYNVQLGRKTILSCGDNVHIRFTPLDIDVQTRITAIEYNPYNTNEVEIEVGDYVPDILDTLQRTQKKTDTALKDAETAKKTASETAASLSEYTKKSEISAEVNKYLDSETGQASIVTSLTGTYVTADKLSGYVEKTELSAEIGAYIDTAAGTAKIVNKLTGTFVKEDSLANYVEKTELSAEIGAYIDTSAGTAKIISAASGTYQKKSDMSGYVTTTNLNTSIGQYIDSTAGTAKIVSACSGEFLTESDLSGYAKTSALTSIEQSVSNVEAAITLSSSYTKNTIGTNVYALLQLVSNPNSSNIKIQADKIDFTGFTTFLRASDLGSSGSTSIDGGRIKTGTISADRIDTSSITLSDVYGKGTYANHLMITSSGHYMYIGSDITTTNGVYESIDIRSGTLGFSNVSTRGLVMDHANKVFRPNSSSATGGYSLGTSTYQWNNLYVNKIYLGGKELTAGASMAGSSVTMGGSTSYYIVCNTSRELRPYSTSTTYPCYLGTSSYYWHYAYIGSNTASIGSSGTSKLGFFGTTPATRQTVSNTATVATLITALKKYGLIA